MSTEQMMRNFAQYIDPPIPPNQCIVGMPLGTRCHRIERIGDMWRVWIATDQSYMYGTWLELYDDGTVLNVTVRRDEGDEEFKVRPSDDEIRRKLCQTNQT